MTFKFSAAKLLSLAAVGVFAIGLGATHADAQTKRKAAIANTAAGSTAGTSAAYGPAGPNRSYQSGRTRVFVTTRSWLDAGVEVLPGDRKFSDYAYPPSTSFGQQNYNRPLDRQPLYSPYDLGGYPQGFPLY